MGAIERYFHHMNADEFGAMVAQFAPDAKVCVPGSPPVRGRAAIESLYRRMFRPWPEHHDEPVRIVGAGRTVTVNVRFTGAMANGHRSAFDAVDVFDLDENNLIASLTNWYDSHAVRKEMAASRESGSAARLEPLRTRLNILGICATLGLECIELRPKVARVLLRPSGDLRHRTGAVPGAAIAALADVAGSFAIHTVAPKTSLLATVDLSTHFIAPAVTAPLMGEGRVERAGPRRAFATVRVTDATQDLCALATGTWAITPDSPDSLTRDIDDALELEVQPT